MTALPFSRQELHAALDALLDTTGSGSMDPDALWEFVTGLAQGRGVTENLHKAGSEAAAGVGPSPAATFNARQIRAYHIGLLVALLMQVGRMPGQGSILPGNFQHGVVAHDLLGMLQGPGGMGEGDPQILTSAKGGKVGLRRAARRRLVGVVRWRMGRTRATREDVWFGLMGYEAEKSMLDRWQREFGGAEGWLCREAFAAGAAGDTTRPWAASDHDLKPVIELALSGPGKRRQDQ